MATRSSSRRSAGGADVLNRAMVNLLPFARLKEECEKRGLPTDGNKQALSSRLEDSLDGVYVLTPVAAAPTTSSTPSTSNNPSTTTTPKSRSNSAKAPPANRTPRRRTSTGDNATAPKKSAPPSKKPRRNSTKKEEESHECSIPAKEEEEEEDDEDGVEEVIEEGVCLRIATPMQMVDQFDSDDDQPLIRVIKEVPVVAVDAIKVEEIKQEVGEDEKEKEEEEKEKRRSRRRKRKEEDDIESGAVLSKGDSEWKPPEEMELRRTRGSARKRTRSSMDKKREEEDDDEEEESSPPASMPVLDPEIYDQDGKDDEKKATTVQNGKASSDEQAKSASTNEAVKRVKKDSFSAGSSMERPRSISTAAAPSSSAAVSKEKRRESTAAAAPSSSIVRPAKEKPATQKFAELMAQKKAEAARLAAAAAAAAAAASATTSASNGGGEGSGGGTPTSIAPVAATVIKSESTGSSGERSPLITEKNRGESRSRRDSATGCVGSPAAMEAAAARGGFSMIPRRNAPPRPAAAAAAPSSSSDLLGDLLGKQQVLLEKKVKSSAETEAEKIRIVSEMKQRAPDLRINEGTVKSEKEKLQKEKEERERAREERERREREKNVIVIRAPDRPIPPPPPPKRSRDESSSSVAKVKEEVEEETAAPPTYQPMPTRGLAGDGGPNEVGGSEPEYEPLSPGPSLSLLDRSLADAHHRERKEREERKRREERSKDHALKAPEAPFSADDPFILRLADKLKNIKRQREASPIPDEVRECMEDLLKKVEEKVEKELKWERRTKRKTEYQVEREKADEKKLSRMMLDPQAFLAKAAHIYNSQNGSKESEQGQGGSGGEPPVDPSIAALHIAQHIAEPGTYTEDTEEKKLPEFHGDPVPSDDEDLFNEAAGLRKDKKPKHPVIEEEAPPSHEHILLDYYNACLQIKSATEKPWLIEPDNEHGLALMWGGVRANHGYVLPWREERACLVFQIKVVEHQSIRHIPFNEQEPHDVRVGFSLRASPNILGEAPLSWSFSTTGKKCANNTFQEWGDPIEIGDVVTAVLDFSTNSISFYKNDACMGVAFKDIVLPDADAVYPHVCVKNCKVEVNLGSFPEVEGGWTGAGERAADWLFPTEIERKKYEMSRLPPNEKAACTLLMMVGLPGVGKTTWVRQYTRDHPEEKWDVINSEEIMAAMKVNGVPRGRAHTGRWDMVMGLVGKSLFKMVLLAARRRRNYIVDMTNVNKDARKRKLMHFKDFTIKCIVIVPEEEEMVTRQMKQARDNGTSNVPAEAILEMKAVYSFPSEETEGITEVHLIEPPMPRVAEAIEIIQRYNDEGKPWYQKRYRGRGSRRGGRGGYMGGGDRRGDNSYGRPISVSTAASNGSGPPTHLEGGGGGAGPSGAWGRQQQPESPATAGGKFSWASRK